MPLTAPATTQALSQSEPAIVATDIPARLDRLPWGRFHTLVVIALGITWILDGLEVTLAGAISPALKDSPVLHFSNADVGLASSAYLAGAVLGALYFGWLTDRLGARSCSSSRLPFIPGHRGYVAVLELVELRPVSLPHRSGNRWRIHRHQFHHSGGCAGAVSGLDRSRHQWQLLGWRGNRRGWIDRIAGSGDFLIDLGWRFAFLIGACLGLIILLMRFWLPEFPRWLMIYGRAADAERVVLGIEAEFRPTVIACRPQQCRSFGFAHAVSRRCAKSPARSLARRARAHL